MQDMIISGYVNHEDSASYTSYRCFKIICYWIIYRYHINIITLIFLHHARLLHPPIELSVILCSMHTVYFVPIVCMSLSFVRRLVWIIQKIYLLYNHWQRASLLTCSYSCSKCENIDKLCIQLSSQSYIYIYMACHIKASWPMMTLHIVWYLLQWPFPHGLQITLVAYHAVSHLFQILL